MASKPSVVKKHSNDTSHLLRTPLHGVYIPAALLVVGVGIMDYKSLPLAVLAAAVLAGFKVYRGMSASVMKFSSWNEVELEEVTQLTRDTRMYRFKLPKENDQLGMPIGQAMDVRVKVEGEELVRSYTPIAADTKCGYFELIVKSYPEGTVSKHFASMKPTQAIDIRGPVGQRYEYSANMVPKLGMVAGGSGITPFLQLVDAIVRNPEDKTTISLIYANKTKKDILLKDDLDELAEKYPNFEVCYVIEEEDGYVTQDMLKKYLPEPSSTSQLLVSGPPAMCDSVVESAQKLGYKEPCDNTAIDQTVVFPSKITRRRDWIDR